MQSKEYKLPNGKKAIFEYDITTGVGEVDLECMDKLMAMITDRPQGWIPVSEGLPEESGNYLIADLEKIKKKYAEPQESEEHVRPDITYEENELYREIEIFSGDTKVGKAEVDIKNKMLSRLSIYEPYQNKGIGTQVVADLTKEYGLTNLWVNADNERAIYVYKKCGYRKVKPTMYLMERSEEE